MSDAERRLNRGNERLSLIQHFSKGAAFNLKVNRVFACVWRATGSDSSLTQTDTLV